MPIIWRSATKQNADYATGRVGQAAGTNARPTSVRENQQDLGRTTLDFVQFQQATLRNGLIHQKLLTGSG